jgi:hypothetical protein
MFMCVKSNVNRSLTNCQKYASVIPLGNLQEAPAENSLLIFKKENTILHPVYELRKNTYVPKLLHPVLDITKPQWGFISINRRDFEAGHCTLLKTGKQQKYAMVNGVVKICPFCNIWAQMINKIGLKLLESAECFLFCGTSFYWSEFSPMLSAIANSCLEQN